MTKNGKDRPRPFRITSVIDVVTYMLWNLYPFSKGREAFHISWTRLKGYPFLNPILSKVQSEQATLILVTPAWQAQS